MSQTEFRTEAGASRARDAAIRRTRAIIAGVAAGAVGLSGLLSAVAAQAFKGHAQRTASSATAVAKPAHRSRTPRVSVPRPQPIPSIAGQPTPLQPPAQPPAAATPQATQQAPVPEPQVSGGS